MNEFNDQLIIAKLKETHLHVTQNRVAVYKILKEQNTALSVSAILRNTEFPLNRISVYRALRYFLQNGIVQLIPNNKGVAKYILTPINTGRVNRNNSKHAYFFCTSCNLTEIIQAVSIQFDLFTKYQVNSSCLILEGLCTDCRK